MRNNEVRTVMLHGVPIVALVMENMERLCLAQISNTLLKNFSYNEIHNRRVALGITCVQCTPVQLELLRRAGAMPVSSRRCGMITKREAERLCKSFLSETAPPKLPDSFSFDVQHNCAWGCRGHFNPSRYNSSRAKCIKCFYCGLFFSPNKFIFHSHRLPESKYVQPDAANFNSWRRHIKLFGTQAEDIAYAWEDVKAMFNGGSRKRAMAASLTSVSKQQQHAAQQLKQRNAAQSPSYTNTSSESMSPPHPNGSGPSGTRTHAGNMSPSSGINFSPMKRSRMDSSESPEPQSMMHTLSSPGSLDGVKGFPSPHPSSSSTPSNPMGHPYHHFPLIPSLVGKGFPPTSPHAQHSGPLFSASSSSLAPNPMHPTQGAGSLVNGHLGHKPMSGPHASPSDFRQSFAEFMGSSWAQASGKPPTSLLPYNYFLWPRPPASSAASSPVGVDIGAARRMNGIGLDEAFHVPGHINEEKGGTCPSNWDREGSIPSRRESPNSNPGSAFKPVNLNKGGRKLTMFRAESLAQHSDSNRSSSPGDSIKGSDQEEDNDVDVIGGEEEEDKGRSLSLNKSGPRRDSCDSQLRETPSQSDVAESVEKRSPPFESGLDDFPKNPLLPMMQPSSMGPSALDLRNLSSLPKAEELHKLLTSVQSGYGPKLSPTHETVYRDEIAKQLQQILTYPYFFPNESRHLSTTN